MFSAATSLLPNIDILTKDVYQWNEGGPSELNKGPLN